MLKGRFSEREYSVLAIYLALTICEDRELQQPYPRFPAKRNENYNTLRRECQ